MRPGPGEKKKKINEPSEKEKDDKNLKEEKGKVTNVPVDRPGYTDTSQERPDNPNPL